MDIIARDLKMSSTFLKYFKLFFQQQIKKFFVGEGGFGVGCVQDGVDVVGVIFDLLGVGLGRILQVAAQVADQQAGDDRQLHAAHQIVVTDGLEPVAVDKVPGQGQVGGAPCAGGGGIQTSLPLGGVSNNLLQLRIR